MINNNELPDYKPSLIEKVDKMIRETFSDYFWSIIPIILFILIEWINPSFNSTRTLEYRTKDVLQYQLSSFLLILAMLQSVFILFLSYVTLIQKDQIRNLAKGQILLVFWIILCFILIQKYSLLTMFTILLVLVVFSILMLMMSYIKDIQILMNSILFLQFYVLENTFVFLTLTIFKITEITEIVNIMIWPIILPLLMVLGLKINSYSDNKINSLRIVSMYKIPYFTEIKVTIISVMVIIMIVFDLDVYLSLGFIITTFSGILVLVKLLEKKKGDEYAYEIYATLKQFVKFTIFFTCLLFFYFYFTAIEIQGQIYGLFRSRDYIIIDIVIITFLSFLIYNLDIFGSRKDIIKHKKYERIVRIYGTNFVYGLQFIVFNICLFTLK